MTDLNQYNDAWDEAQVKRFGNVAPGTYQASVEEARISHPEWMEHPQLSLKMKVMQGEWAGSGFYCQNSFDPARIGFLKSAVAAMGLKPPIKAAGEVESRCEDMLGRVLTVKVVHNDNPNNPEKPYVNVYIQNFIGMKDDLMAEMGEGELDKLGF